MKQILIVEDDELLNKMLVYNLQSIVVQLSRQKSKLFIMN